MLNGLVVENVVNGGPAFNSNMIERGDIILRVDGMAVSSDSVREALIGDDKPGGSVVLTIQKGSPTVGDAHSCDPASERTRYSQIVPDCPGCAAKSHRH